MFGDYCTTQLVFSTEFSKLDFPPNNSIMEAVDSRMGSYAWESILKDRDVLQCGARWWVYNGEKIKIW